MAGSSRKVNVEVALSGEAKYKQAITELNAANKTMGAELKRLSAEYKGNTDSMDFLTQKGETLQSMLDHQKEKVEQLREAVKWSAQEYGEASTKTQSYAAQLANAETSVINLEQAIQENNKAMQQQAHSTEEYDQALKVLYSELAEIDSEIRAQGESVENLGAKHETLTAILEEQEQKYRTLCDALKEAEESGTATQEEINDLKIKVNEAATAYNNTSAAIKENEAALQDHVGAVQDEKESLTGIGDVLSDMTDKIGVKLPDGATKALNGLKGFSAGTVAAMATAAAGIAACVKAVTELHNLAVQYAAEADDIITKSAITGLSTTLLQELQYAEPLIDVSVETITGSMTKLTKNIADAAGGNESLAASFDRLGVSVTNSDGSLRSVQEVFFELIDALGEVGNETERNALAMELFGKSATELNPLIQQGSEVLQEYAEEAHELYVLTDRQVAALGSLDDQVQKNTLSWEGLKKQIVAEFAPASEEALKNFGELVKNAGKALIDSGIIKGVGEIFAALSNMINPLSELLGAADSAPGRLGPVYEVLHGIAGVVAWIADAADAVIGLLTLDFSRVGVAMGYGKSSGNYSNMQKWMGYGDTTGNYYNSQTGMWEGNYGRNAGGTDNWRGGLTWVGESGPELVSLPKGSQITNAQDSKNMMGGNIFYVTIDAKNVKEFNDIVRMCQRAQAEERMG